MDSILLTSLALGFLLGIKHALDADHIVAVSTIVSQNRSIFKSSLVGVFWGLGHTTTLFIVGLGVLVFRLTIPPTLALSMEFAVGIVLVFLGVSIIWDYLRKRLHAHAHEHDGEPHQHFHTHDQSEGHTHEHILARQRKSLLVGMVHGLAGSAALTLLVLTTVKSLVEGLSFILIFGIGSILGMLLVTTVISLPFVFTASHFARINEPIRIVAGVISIGLGLMLMAEIGFIQGLIYQI